MTKRKKYMRFGLFIFSCSVVLFVSGCKTQQTEDPSTAGPTSSKMKQAISVETPEESNFKKKTILLICLSLLLNLENHWIFPRKQ